MNVTFRCQKCASITREQYLANTTLLTCPACQTVHKIPSDAIGADATGQIVVTRCMVCPGKELYFRNQFNQRLGITIIGLGFAASTIAYYYHHLMWVYGILFFTAGWIGAIVRGLRFQKVFPRLYTIKRRRPSPEDFLRGEGGGII